MCSHLHIKWIYCKQVNDCNRLPLTSWWIGKSDINRWHRHRLGNQFCVAIKFEVYFGIGRVNINLRWAFFLKEAVSLGRTDVNTYMKNVDRNESENGTEKYLELIEKKKKTFRINCNLRLRWDSIYLFFGCS